MVQLFAALRILHQLFFLLQHGGKAARCLKIERHIVCFFCRRFRLRRCLGGCGSFLRGTVILSSQVKLFRFFVHPCTQPAIADESAHPLEGTGLFLVHGFQRQALFAVKAFCCLGQTEQRLAGLQAGCTGSDHPHEHGGDSRKAPAGDPHRPQRKAAHGCSIFSHKAVLQKSLQNRRIGRKQARRTQTGNRRDAKDHRKRDADCQQCAACAVALFGTGADLVCRGRLCLAEHLPEPAGNTCGLRVDIVLIQALFFRILHILAAAIVFLPAAAERLCRFAKAKVCSIHRRTAHTIGAVANVLPFALKAMGKGIRHGIAKGAQLVFQLLLHLTALIFSHCIVFTIVHQILLTLLPVHTG